MRLVELRYRGERPFVLDLHPNLTVVYGLGDDGRRWMRELLTGIFRGQLDNLTGVIEVHGVRRELSAAAIASLGLTEGLDLALQPVQLPGAEMVPGGEAHAAPPPPAPAPLAVTSTPPAPAQRAELDAARVAMERAADARARADAALAAAGAALDPRAADAVSEAEVDLAAARRRSEAVRQQMEAALAAGPSAEQAAGATARAERAGRRDELEARRADVLRALEEPAPDPGPVAAALGALRRQRAAAPSSTQATIVAAALARVRSQLAAIPPHPAAPAALVADARRALAAALAELAEAEEANHPVVLDPDAVARLEAAHAAVLEAEEKGDRRTAMPAARKRLEAARRDEAAALELLGFPSYGAYQLRTSTAIAESGAQMRLTRAQAALADAEAVWDELHAGTDGETWTELRADEAELREQALALLGRDPGLGQEEEALAALVESTRDEAGPRDDLARALAAAGAPMGRDPEVSAEAWLAAADEAHARRATLQAELAALGADLEELAREDAAAPAPPRADDQGLVAVREELSRAGAAEQAAHRALVAAQARRSEASAANQRVQALADEVEGARAAEAQAVARVRQLEELGGARGHVAEPGRWVPASPAPPAVPASAGKVDLRGVTRSELEVYVLARVAAQRDVGDAGALPLVVDDALAGLSPRIVEPVLHQIERFSSVLQVIYLTDDADIAGWAEQFGADEAALRRFSPRRTEGVRS